jgi:hypothetical protein
MGSMESSSRRHLILGEQLQGVVYKSIGGKRFLVSCKAVPEGWTVELQTRNLEDVTLGANHSFWIANITPLKRTILVHDGEFGRLPISEAMKGRYLASLQALAGESDLTGDALAEAKSMVVRVEKKNQADWLSVWKVLGEPSSGDFKELLQAIEAMRSARKENPEALSELRETFVGKYGLVVEGAIRKLSR